MEYAEWAKNKEPVIFSRAPLPLETVLQLVMLSPSLTNHKPIIRVQASRSLPSWL